ncbi:MAG: helix-turn-helix domain-containing protein [Chloroflexi bacterium]|nr:helix-turn-helix domain-containing protein [Chloroflexota bacterium]
MGNRKGGSTEGSGDRGRRLNPGPLISLKEAALHTGLSHSHLRLLARTGRIQAVRMGRDWFTRLDEVVRYIASRRK